MLLTINSREGLKALVHFSDQFPCEIGRSGSDGCGRGWCRYIREQYLAKGLVSILRTLTISKIKNTKTLLACGDAFLAFLVFQDLETIELQHSNVT
eukprot:767821-Hanusia_phi.AAC.2